MSNVTTTSVRAYYAFDGKQTLRSKILAVMSASKTQGMTINEIARKLNLERSTTSARLNELKAEPFYFEAKLCVLQLICIRKSLVSNVTSEAWGIVELSTSKPNENA